MTRAEGSRTQPVATLALRNAAATVAAVTVVTGALIAAARSLIPPENYAPDFIQFWTAATLLVSQQDPYDPALQAAVQSGLGWQRDVQGLGIYEFLPFYYPPWLALPVIPLLALSYPTAKVAWIVLGIESLALSAWLLRKRVGGVSAGLTFALVLLFGFSIRAVAIGQVVPLVLLLVASTWALLDKRRDAAAGAVLAWLTIKPQLTLLLIGAVLVWAARRGRTRVWAGFGGMLGLLAAACILAVPEWPMSMLSATWVTPMPFTHYPGAGATWFVVLDALGMSGAALWTAYAALALPATGLLLHSALGRTTGLHTLFGLGLLAPFFAAPYARLYDYPVLVVAALVLVSRRIRPPVRSLFALVLLTVPSLHLLFMAMTYVRPMVGVRRPEFTCFWVPLLIATVWLASDDRRVAAAHG